MTNDLLTVTGLRKSFGGVLATDELNLCVRKGEIHAIIGPNGAGKTTLIRQLTGEIKQDHGHITFAGGNIDKCSIPARCHKGLARTFQITSLFQDFTVLQNVVLAVQAQAGHSFRFWKNVNNDKSLTDPAKQYLARVGLETKLHVLVSALSHGEQRQLEIAVALASKPKMLLMDEPMAGMSVEDSWKLVDTLKALKDQQNTILLIEHDMDVVFALADRISVLVYGRIIATGSAAEIKSDPEVRMAYLGDEGGLDACG
ncbi:ABC transporter ATP-binding protein [Moritella sp. 5]|uniref:ABC transporter ATP-binding protein n=1 Tax=Moritella sp. 5 TaxID=2746231 RepID=UPI001BABE6B1|nr:ABC transporter ATP-binding protein [Moritella sp. 5]QUM81270.1 ABC transporter ATP-binding protein [Moritella sp. 5]